MRVCSSFAANERLIPTLLSDYPMRPHACCRAFARKWWCRLQHCWPIIWRTAKVTTMARPITIDGALSDKALFGAGLGDPGTWLTWRSVLKAAYVRPLLKRERAAFDLVAGGRSPPTRKVRELVVVVSRRAGKGRMSGACAVFEAALVNHSLAPGEVGVVGCVSRARARPPRTFRPATRGIASRMLHADAPPSAPRRECSTSVVIWSPGERPNRRRQLPHGQSALQGAD
jgi:hypothetical protein